MSSSVRFLVIAAYVLISALIVFKSGYESGDYLKMAFSLCSFVVLFIIYKTSNRNSARD
jgi:hypothetical protein